MANHPQAIKRNRQRLKVQAHHRHFRSTMRTYVKRVRTALDQRDDAGAKVALKEAVPVIDSCAQKGIIPKKRASRIVSRLTRAVSGLAAGS